MIRKSMLFTYFTLIWKDAKGSWENKGKNTRWLFHVHVSIHISYRSSTQGKRSSFVFILIFFLFISLWDKNTNKSWLRRKHGTQKKRSATLRMRTKLCNRTVLSSWRLITTSSMESFNMMLFLMRSQMHASFLYFHSRTFS